MNKFTRSLLTEWRKLDLPFANQTFIAAVSGGADSVSLLLALHELKKLEKLNLRFVIAHFNHDLRGAESEADEDFVKKLTIEFGFELVLRKGEISGEGNLEQNARTARYNFLFDTAENLDAAGILTAHTLNDQAETFLHNLLRGSGLQGLGGMKSVSVQGSMFKVQGLRFKIQDSKVESQNSEFEKQDLDNQSKIQNLKSKIKLIRPLLRWAKREDTENFCRLNKIEFRNDSMNENLKFNRVRIRKILLPLLQDFNPKIIETLAQTALLLREENEFLNAATKRLQAERQQLSKASKNKEYKTQHEKSDKESLPLKELVDLFPSMRRRILRDWLKEQRGDLRSLDAKHFAAIENLIFSRKSGRTVELPNGEFLLKNKGNLTFMKNKG